MIRCPLCEQEHDPPECREDPLPEGTIRYPVSVEFKVKKIKGTHTSFLHATPADLTEPRYTWIAMSLAQHVMAVIQQRLKPRRSHSWALRVRVADAQEVLVVACWP